MTDELETADRRGRGPEPIKRTVQRLFAEQVSCARPECPRRLFYELDGNEVKTCEVAHICAYSAIGPRHDPSLEPDETRAFKNLLLLKFKPAVEHNMVTLLPTCLLYTSPSPRDKRQSRMPSSA